MTREEKNKEKEILQEQISNSGVLYLTDISGLNAIQTSELRASCFKNDIQLRVVKNKLLQKALESIEGTDYSPFFETLKGNTAIMISEIGSAPAKLIKNFRKKSEKPILKGAFIEESFFIGDNLLDDLVNLKSKEELIADVVALLQSPLKNVISALGSGSNKLTGILTTLEQRG